MIAILEESDGFLIAHPPSMQTLQSCVGPAFVLDVLSTNKANVLEPWLLRLER